MKKSKKIKLVLMFYWNDGTQSEQFLGWHEVENKESAQKMAMQMTGFGKRLVYKEVSEDKLKKLGVRKCFPNDIREI